MSEATTTEVMPAQGAVPAVAEPIVHEEHEHAGPRQYVMIAVVLAIVTALEIGVSYMEDSLGPNWIILLLGVMAAIKFFLVAAWFMHLRFDSPILRRLFLVGLIAAPILYLILLATLHVFDPSL